MIIEGKVMTKYFDERVLRETLKIGYNCDHCSYDAQRCYDDVRFTQMHLCDIVDNLPVADVAPVKHAHWYDVFNYLGTGKRMYVCSECGAGSSREDPYCWHCGSKMDVSDIYVGKKEVKEYDE